MITTLLSSLSIVLGWMGNPAALAKEQMMISLSAVFVMFLILFGFIGAARGWAKEVLVIASVVLALAAIRLLEDLVGLKRLIGDDIKTQYYIRMAILTLLTFFGYQSPKVQRIAKATEKRGIIAEQVLGFIFGMLSGYFVIGSAWAFTAQAKYPLLADQLGGTEKEQIIEAVDRLMGMLPPVYLDQPLKVFVVLVITFIIVIVFFV